MDYAEEMVAMPGMSEHHTGQAIDIAIKKDGNWITDNDQLAKEVDIFNKIHSSLKLFGSLS